MSQATIKPKLKVRDLLLLVLACAFLFWAVPKLREDVDPLYRQQRRLHDPSARVRVDALGEIQRIAVKRPEILIPLFLTALYDPDDEVRANAACYLCRVPDDDPHAFEVRAALFEVLDDRSSDVVRWATYMRVSPDLAPVFRQEIPRVIGELRLRLSKGDSSMLQKEIAAVGARGAISQRALQDSHARDALASLLFRIVDAQESLPQEQMSEIHSVVERLMDDPSIMVRSSVCGWLARQVTNNRNWMPLLLKLAFDPDASVRSSAIRSLPISEQDFPTIFPVLSKAFREKDHQVCDAVVKILKTTHADLRTIPQFDPASKLESEDPLERFLAVYLMDVRNGEEVTKLVPSLEDKDPRVRAVCRARLRMLRFNEAKSVLRRVGEEDRESQSWYFLLP